MNRLFAPLVLASGLLIASTMAQAQPAAVQSPGDQFRVLITSDPQVGPENTDNPNLRGPNQQLQAFAETANSLSPVAVIFAGDLTFSGDAASVDNFAQLVEPIQSPVILARGALDRGAYFDNKLSGYESEQLGYADFRIGRWRFLVAPPPEPLDNKDAQKKILDWLSAALAKDRRRPTILVHHFPLLPVGVSSMEADALPTVYRRELIDLLTGAGQLKYVISGHAQPGVQASILASMQFRDVNFLLAPTLVRPRAFGEEYAQYDAQVPNNDHGYFMIMDFDGEDVTINGAKVGREGRFEYPQELAVFDDSRDIRSLVPLREIPAANELINGSFEEPLTVGWHSTHRYRASDGRGGNVTRQADRYSNGQRAIRMRVHPRGSAWTRDESMELYQMIDATGWSQPRVRTDYWVTGPGRSYYGGGYIRVALYGKDDRPRTLIFHWGARESRVVFLPQIMAYHDTGSARPRKWLREQNSLGNVLAWEIPDDQGRWHALDLNVAQLYDAYHGNGAYEALGVTRLLFAFGVWLGPELRTSTEALLDNVRITDDAEGRSTAGRRKLPLTERHRGSPYALWTLDQ